QAGPIRAIFFNNRAVIVAEPEFPIQIEGDTRVAGHPWYESRMFAPAGPPPTLSPNIAVRTPIPPSDFLRPPGRTIPTPFNRASYSFAETSTAGIFGYQSRWAAIFTPRDGRSTVALTLIDRGNSIAFDTNFDLLFDVDQQVIENASGAQRFVVQ